jgi:hypothetical protein
LGFSRSARWSSERSSIGADSASGRGYHDRNFLDGKRKAEPFR